MITIEGKIVFTELAELVDTGGQTSICPTARDA
jgi:hypothetical protein